MPWRLNSAFAPGLTEAKRSEYRGNPREAFRQGTAAAKCIFDVHAHLEAAPAEQSVLGLVLAAALALDGKTLVSAGADPHQEALATGLLIVGSADQITDLLLASLREHSVEWHALLSPLTDVTPAERATALVVPHFALSTALAEQRRIRRRSQRDGAQRRSDA